MKKLCWRKRTFGGIYLWVDRADTYQPYAWDHDNSNSISLFHHLPSMAQSIFARKRDLLYMVFFTIHIPIMFGEFYLQALNSLRFERTMSRPTR